MQAVKDPIKPRLQKLHKIHSGAMAKFEASFPIRFALLGCCIPSWLSQMIDRKRNYVCSQLQHSCGIVCNFKTCIQRQFHNT
ncbi:unnamed protein product [Brassica napus]|uniref:(rape) hypothetical protein n=1 Tax=Brassica napus TaxID=3708 RepID=A0A816PHF2_BRANA|nr:unnamed protein product [Brassica napus]